MYQRWVYINDPEDRKRYRSRAQVEKHVNKAKNEMWLKVYEEIKKFDWCR